MPWGAQGSRLRSTKARRNAAELPSLEARLAVIAFHDAHIGQTAVLPVKSQLGRSSEQGVNVGCCGAWRRAGNTHRSPRPARWAGVVKILGQDSRGRSSRPRTAWQSPLRPWVAGLSLAAVQTLSQPLRRSRSIWGSCPTFHAGGLGLASQILGQPVKKPSASRYSMYHFRAWRLFPFRSV